jgi:PAS domain S-box-containing protein
MDKSIPLKMHDFLSGGGEMGERIRSFDWSQTPLGEPENWEQSLKTCVHIMLTSSQPIWIGWGKDLIKLYNDPYKAIVGGKHPRALGQPASVVWKDIWSDIEPMLNKVMNDDEGTYVESQLLIMERYGYPEETYYTFSYTPVLGDNGKPAGMICYNTADTERRINERLLQTLRQLDAIGQKKTELEIYQQAVKALETNNRDFPFAIVYKIQNEGNLATFLASTGIDPSHPELQHSINLENPNDKGKNIAVAVKENRIVQSVNNGRWKDLPRGAWNVMPQQYVHVPIKAVNKKFPLAILTLGLNPYRKFDEVFANFVQLVADQISFGVNNALAYEEERKRAQALEELDKAKTIFFSNISHEFRTPLTLMLGTLEEALDDKAADEKVRTQLLVAHRNAMRLLKLVNTLLDFSRIESGRQKANFTRTDIAIFTRNLAGNFESIIEKAGLQFTMHVKPIQSPVYVDREMWEKIVFNLLSNAFKYTLVGNITVSLFQQGNNVVLEVEDTGVGIPENELPHMFDRFHRMHNTVGRTYEGTGIGLSLTKELVQLHGGSISVKSKTGKGSCFVVTIPCGKEHLPSNQISETEAETELILSNLYIEEAVSLLDNIQVGLKEALYDRVLSIEAATVLVVDDNADMRHHIGSVLEKHFNVITAANGMEALEKIKAENPSLVLSDIMMPVMDGIELLRHIKQGPQTSRIPVILLTARAGEESRVEGFETGADDYLVKPFAASELIARVRAQVRIAQARREADGKIKNVFAQVPASIAIVEGPEHVYTLANKLYCKLFGRKEHELIGHTVKEIYPEVEGQGIFEILDNVYNTGKPFLSHGYPATFNENGKQKTGYYDLAVHPIRNNEGEIKDLVIISFEVTESVIARQKIEESEQRFRSLANEAPLFVWLTDEALYTTFLNETGLKYFNVDTITGLSWKKFIHPDDIERVLKIMNVAALQQAPYTLEMRLKNNASGQYRWFLDKGVPRYNDGKFIGFIGTSLDIDDRKQAEKILQESEERFRTLTEALPQLIWMTDDKGVQQFVSKSWNDYSGIMPTGPETWKEIVHPADVSTINEEWLHSLSTGSNYKIEVRLKSKEGEFRWHYGQGEPIKNNDGKIVNWIGAFTDIHDQKTFADKLEAEVAQRTHQLERSNKELESFNYIASHDLQEPLRKIQTFILMLEKNRDDSEARKKYVDKILTSAQRMSQLIQSVLDYSRLSQANNNFETTDLNRVLEIVKSDYELLINEKGAVIQSEVLPVIQAVPLQMQQLFSNLISNSLKFSKEKPIITITWKKVSGNEADISPEMNGKGCFAEIKFTDNGIGFEPQYKEQIFKLFQRLHSRSEYSGTGVGLSIVSKIVERHNGFIKASSGNNNGATFTILLPLE